MTKSNHADDWGFTECCEGLLSTFFDWTPLEVGQWCEQYLPEARDPDSWFNRETPVYYCTPLLIPDSIRNTLDGLQRLHFEQRLELAILGDRQAHEFSRDDWLEAKSRVEKVLGEFGESLTNAPGAKREGRLRH
jgi:hypothetical protein